jgi:branched-chain amino acid transport system permease protein
MKNINGSILILIAVLAIIGLSLPLWTSTFTMQLATRGLILGVLAMSFSLLAGYADMISLAQMSFAAIAGYVIGIGVMHFGLAHSVLILPAILAAVILAAIFGWIAIRATKIYFLMMTLALAQLFFGIVFQWVSLTEGYPGITGIPRPSMFGISLIETPPLYYVTLVVTVLCYLALRRLVRSPFGLVLQGIRDNPKRMAALGFNVQLHRYLVIVVSGTFAGIAGILMTYFTGVISPNRAALTSSILVVMAALVGSVTSLEGGLLGGLVIAFLMSIASQFTTRYWTVIGTLFILIVLFMPNGLLGGDIQLGDWFRKLRKRESSQ